MKQNDKYLAEGLDILNREFGQPLPTLEDTTKAYKEIKFGSKAQYDKYKRQHQIRPGTEIEIDGKKSKEKGDVKPDKKVLSLFFFIVSNISCQPSVSVPNFVLKTASFKSFS